MRLFIAFVLFLFSVGVHAGCWDFAELHTETWDIDISDGSCAYGKLMITFSSSGQDTIKIPFESECKEFSEGDVSGFSCEDTGRSPMAGATYRLMQRGEPYCDSSSPDGGETPGHQYVCVEGCRESVPKYLIQTHDCC